LTEAELIEREEIVQVSTLDLADANH
jgi:hypothetical protein